ncbi:MAG: cupredoxin family copper-binding protein [Actinomycetota bacterium]|nr:cupredoxin family copper-binding protein [Actinomycetota bacterium]
MTAILLGVLAVALGLVVSGGSAAGSSGVGGRGLVAVTDLADTVVIKNFAFGPTSLAVAPGTRITVVNQDRAPHTVTARDNSFDTGTIAGGQRGEITAPSLPGTYPYICTIHPSMTGTLIVM